MKKLLAVLILVCASAWGQISQTPTPDKTYSTLYGTGYGPIFGSSGQFGMGYMSGPGALQILDNSGNVMWSCVDAGTVGNVSVTGTFGSGGKVTTPASTSGAASIVLPHGSAPSAPVNGDIWTTTAGLYCRVNGTTVGPFIATAGSTTWSTPGTIGSSTPNTGTFTTLSATGKVTTAASVVGGAGIVLPHGTAPTSPVNGDIWTTTAGLFVRVNGTTVGPLLDTAGTTAWASPGTIGSTAPNTGAFTTLSATGKITSAASTTGTAGLILPHGSAPTSPVNGDVWTTTAGMFVRVNGSTVGPLIDTVTAVPWTAPGTIGSVTPNTGAFTTLAATSLTSGTIATTGKITTPASVVGGAGLILPHGTAPTAPVDGDVWTTTSGLYVRVNGTTKGPLIDTAGATTWSSPGAIGSVAPNTGAFTTLSATGEVTTPASTTGSAGLTLPHGAAPTSPANGDVWTTSAGLYVRVNGTTKGPLVDTVSGSATWSTPGTIGSTTPNTGAFTTLSATGEVTTPASTTGSAGITLPHGTAPTSPANGDVWTTTAGAYVRVNGSTVGPLAGLHTRTMHNLWAGDCIVPATNPAGAPTQTADTSTNKQAYISSSYTNSSTINLQWTRALPRDFNTSSPGTAFIVQWYSGTNSTACTWALKAYDITSGTTLDVAPSGSAAGAQTATTANYPYYTTSQAFTIGGTLAAGDLVQYQLFRDTASSNTVYLIGVEVDYVPLP